MKYGGLWWVATILCALAVVNICLQLQMYDVHGIFLNCFTLIAFMGAVNTMTHESLVSHTQNKKRAIKRAEEPTFKLAL